MAKEELPEHAYLQSVRVKGFRTLKDSEATFVSGLNIIIGGNGVGKSNLLKIVKSSFDGYRRSIDFFESTEFTISSKEANYNLKIVFRNSNLENELPIVDRTILYYHSIVKKDGLLEFDSDNYTSARFGTAQSYFFTNERFYTHLIGFNLPETISFLMNRSRLQLSVSYKEDDVIYSPHPIEYEESFFYYLQYTTWKVNKSSDIMTVIKNKIKIHDEIIDDLRKYSPIKDCRLYPGFFIRQSNDSILIEDLYFEFFINNAWLPWNQLSDGTKRLFYLIHDVHRASSTVLIEEPELGVHPHQFHSIMLFLKEQAQYKQIILTTHSPYALNVLKKDDLESIIIAKLDKDKGSVFKHLNDEQKAKANRYIADVGFLSDYWMHSDLEDDEEED